MAECPIVWSSKGIILYLRENIIGSLTWLSGFITISSSNMNLTCFILPLLQEKPRMFGKDDEISVPSVHKKLAEIMAARGKKGTDRKEQIELLHELLTVAKDNALGAAIYVKIQFNIIMSIYDYNPSVSDPMKNEFWEKVS